MLSDEQKGFFARNGFLQLSGAIDDEACDDLVRRTNLRLPQNWAMDDPSTWKGDVPDSCHIADIRHRRGLFQFKHGDLIDNPTLARVFYPGQHAGKIAESLIGAPLAPLLVRGLYCIVPLDGAIRYSPLKKPHIESHPSHLVTFNYLADVDPDGGGLLVWPGSHREIYPAMLSKLEHSSGPNYPAIFDRWTRKEPIQLHGKKGDMIIIHHRLFHAPSLNRIDKIRYAFVCDYRRADYLKQCAQAPTPKVWQDWPAISALPLEIRNAPCDFALPKQKVSAEVIESALALTKTLDNGRTDPSSIKKADASLIVRDRKAGDIWLTLSDSPLGATKAELYPRGSDLASEGVTVHVNDVPVTPFCKYDIYSRLTEVGPSSIIRVDGLKTPAWLRLIRVKLPFSTSEVIAHWELPPGSSERELVLPDVVAQ